MASIKDLVSEIQTTSTNSNDIENDAAAKAKLVQLSLQIVQKLQQPNERIGSMAYANVDLTCIRIAQNLQIFDLLSSGKACSVKDLVAATAAEESLLRRLLRVLASIKLIDQIDGGDTFAALPITKELIRPNVAAGLRFFYDQGNQVFYNAPEHFRDNGYRLPQNTTDGPFQYANHTKEDPYSFWSKQRGVMENFNAFMNGRFSEARRWHWLDWYPLEEACLAGYDASRSEYCFVDVGGGRGDEIQLAVEKYPHKSGRFVLEDLPAVIADTKDQKLNPKIERLAYDFTEPQPIKGARTYLLKNVLHNWPPSVCNTILSRIRDAMIPGYSKILITNMILPEKDVPLRAAQMDMFMLMMHSGAQRNEKEWLELVENAGLEVVRFNKPPGGEGDGVIEVQRPA